MKNIKNNLAKNLSKNFVDSIENKINNNYANANLIKLSFKIILPSLLLSLLLGIYIFIDQMLIINLVPKDGINYLQNYFKSINQLELFNKISLFLQENQSLNIVTTNNKDFIVYASNQVGVFSLMAISFGYLISAGSAVLFSKYLATKEIDKKNKLLTSSIYSSLIFSLIITTFMLIIQNFILDQMMPSSTTISDSALDNVNTNVTINEIRKYFDFYYDGVVNLSSKYIYFINGGIIFLCFSNLIIFYLRAENNNIIPTIIGISCNLINIIFDVVLITVCKLGIMGGGIATFISQFVNIIALISYLIYLNIKAKTTIKLKLLTDYKIDFKLILNSTMLGSSTFLRELSLAIANIVYVPVFYNTIGNIDSVALQSFSKLAAAPLYNLFFFSIFGIIDGLRPIISYNYSIKKYDRVKKTFIIGTIFSLVYSLIAITLVFPLVLNVDSILISFNVTSNYDKNNLVILLLSMFLQFPFISLSVGGLAVFQSANKKVTTILLSLIQGALTFYPVLFTISAIASSTSSVNVMVFTGFINIVISSLIIFVITILFLYRYINRPFLFSVEKLLQINKKS